MVATVGVFDGLAVLVAAGINASAECVRVISYATMAHFNIFSARCSRWFGNTTNPNMAIQASAITIITPVIVAIIREIRFSR